MMQEVEVLKTIPELVCSYFSEEQFTLSTSGALLTPWKYNGNMTMQNYLFKRQKFELSSEDPR